jgi:hypothetical protein
VFELTFRHNIEVTSATLRGQAAGHALVVHWRVPRPTSIDSVEFDNEICGAEQAQDVAIDRAAASFGSAFGRHLTAARERYAVLGVGAGIRPCG